MIAFSRNLFRLSFTVMCVAGVILMVGYWIYKFVIEDRDVGVVDYEQWEKLAVEPPVVSLCIEKPFVIDKLKNITAYNPGGAFLNYLKGETSDDRFRNIDYEDVTINLKTYFLRGNILLSNESTTRKETARIHHKTVFNGFYFNDFKFMNFVKCFEISVSKLEFPNLLHVYYDYDIQKLLKNMSVPFRHRRKIFFNIYNRGQLTWAPNSPQQILMKSGENFQGFHYFIKRIEFLKSRKSRHHECLVEGLPGDMQILEKQIKEKGCRAPYHTLHKSLPLCNNITKLSEYASYGFYDKTRKETRPCQRISYLHYVNAIAPFDPVWRIDVRYPEDVKLISLTKQIDGHALIGNIGGYVGLLLGNI